LVPGPVVGTAGVVSADRIEIAGDEVHELDEPLADRAEGLRRKADAAIGDGRGRVVKLLRDEPDRFRRDARRRRGALDTEGPKS